mgnify:CR=1 FL=1
MIYLTLRFIKYLYFSSMFFFYESRNYVGRLTIDVILYYPVAYFKFMTLMIKEYEPFINSEGETNE